MSNGILPAQSTKPTMREWMLTRLFAERNISLEFYDRLMNLCNYDYPMSPALRKRVTDTFGFEMIGIIEQFNGKEQPVLSSGLRSAIRRVIPDVYYLEFLRLFDCTCCPLIIQEVNDISVAVDGTVVGQLTVERYIEGDGTQHIHLYEWDGADWILLIDSSARVVDGLISGFDCPILTGWEFSLDSGLTWYIEGIVIDPPVSSITVWFRNIVNGCVYTNLPIIPLAYCTDWAVINGGNNFFFFGTVNGVTPPDQAGILATMGEPYQGVQGAIGGVVYNGGGNTIYLQVSRPTGSPVTASLATILDENGLPVSAVPTNTTCSQSCVTATQTLANSPSTYSIDGITVNGQNIAFATFIFIDQAGCADEVKQQIESYGIYDPLLQITIFISGQDVTIQILSVLDFTDIFINSTLGGYLTPFTPCA